MNSNDQGNCFGQELITLFSPFKNNLNIHPAIYFTKVGDSLSRWVNDLENFRYGCQYNPENQLITEKQINDFLIIYDSILEIYSTFPVSSFPRLSEVELDFLIAHRESDKTIIPVREGLNELAYNIIVIIEVYINFHKENTENIFVQEVSEQINQLNSEEQKTQYLNGLKELLDEAKSQRLHTLDYLFDVMPRRSLENENGYELPYLSFQNLEIALKRLKAKSTN